MFSHDETQVLLYLLYIVPTLYQYIFVRSLGMLSCHFLMKQLNLRPVLTVMRKKKKHISDCCSTQKYITSSFNSSEMIRKKEG